MKNIETRHPEISASGVLTGLNEEPHHDALPIIVFLLPSLAGGGAERVALNLASLVDRKSFRPVMMLLEATGPLMHAIPEGVPVLALDRPRLRQALPALITELRRLKPAVIFSTFTHMNLPLLAIRSLLFGAHIVVREANLPSLSLARMPWPAGFRTGCRWLYPTADSIIASSSRMHDELLGMNVPEQKICLLPNPVDELGLRQRAQPIKRKKGEGLRFVAMGRLVPQKGFDRLLDAISSMPGDCNCMILGEGPEDMALKQQSARLGLDNKVAFKGFVANPAPWIAGADAFLMPSRFEGMPNAALEALALGTPVIATPEAGGLSEIQNVTIAIAGNEFISEMQNTLINKTLAPSLLPEKFGLESVARNFNKLISTTLAPGRDNSCSSVI